MTVKGIRLRIDLTAAKAAGLKRLVDKTGWSEAMAVLYPHVDKEIRGNQAREILRALAHIHKALETMNVSSFPWIDCGRGGHITAKAIHHYPNPLRPTQALPNNGIPGGLRR